MKPSAATARAGSRGKKSSASEAPVEEGSFLFLTGWPACGCADFGAWLAENRGYTHLDLDDDAPGHAALREAWVRLLPDDAPGLVRELRGHGEYWVVTGERPASHLPNLTALRTAGFGLWFLQPGMDSHSRQRWLARERELDPAAKPLVWEKLADGIRKNARDLRPHFRDHCVVTLGVEGLITGEALATAIRVPVRS